MSPSFRLLFLCTCFVFLFPVLGHSQNEVHTMREVVVTGTRTDKLVSDAPVKTELLTKQAIEERHYKSAAEALEDLAGVSLVEDVRRPGQSALLQGLGEEHVLVLVDGVPQAQTAAAGYDLSQISTESIERIEVIKGAASALYGSEAMGGVIHVITKKPEGQVRVHADLQTGAYLHQESFYGPPPTLFSDCLP